MRKRKRDEENEECHRKFFNATDKVETDSSDDCDSRTSNEDSDKDESPVEKFRRGEGLPSDLDLGSNENSNASSSDNSQDDGDWNMMGAALEREFLGLED